MSDPNETSADIIAEMRKLGELDEKSTDKITHSLMGLGLRTYADRIEAAAKREKAQSGNAAAVREALDKLVNFLRWEYAQDYPVSRDKLADAIDIGVAALSTPPRNCDRYDSYGDAIRAFEDDGNMEDYEEMAEWLYAPVPEQEGETDGSI